MNGNEGSFPVHHWNPDLPLADLGGGLAIAYWASPGLDVQLR